MRDDGEKQEVIITLVRPAIPAVVGDESGNITEVQKANSFEYFTVQHNYFSFLLQTSPIKTNPKMLATVEELLKRLLLGQIKAKYLLTSYKN